MKICSPHCGAEPQSQSGGESYERMLIKWLADHGDDVHVILARHKTAMRGASVVHRPPIWRGLRWWVTPFVWPPAIWRCWSACGGFDVLRAHSVRYAGPSCLIARRLLRLPVPVVTHIHHLDPSPLNWQIERRVLMASDLVITDSDFAQGQLTGDLGIPADHIRVANSGISTEKHHPRPEAAARYTWPGRAVVAACGQLIERKDPMFALRVLEALKVKGYGERIGLSWLGEGPMRAACEQYAQEHGLTQMVRFEGFVDDSVQQAIYNRCDVFVHPSVREGFALAPQGAMACGKPVVCRPAASMGEMVKDGHTGFVRQTEAEWADAIIQLVTDAQLREVMGRNALEDARNRFTFDRTAKLVRGYYEEAIAARRR